MKIKIDDDKIVYLNVIVFKKQGSDIVEINQSVQKNATDPMDAIVKSITELQRQHVGVVVLAKSTLSLKPNIFIDK